ncbi:MAG TPA: DUF5719 family protein, partial [Acidimicrobiales bacterium]|nr:DUF5719 family protein [Acidimicrobiales bacterium]
MSRFDPDEGLLAEEMAERRERRADRRRHRARRTPEHLAEAPGPARAPLIAVLAALLTAAFGADTLIAAHRAPAAGPLVMARAAAPGALASTWYCGGGTATPGGVADAEVIIANPGTEPLAADITAVPSLGARATRRLSVPPRGRVVVRPRELVQAPFAAAFVRLHGGGGVVEEGVSGPLGFDLAPCATSGSRQWFLAEGATTKGSTLLLMLFNPFPEDAIVDMAFATDQGRAVPSDLQGVVVPPMGLVAIDVGQHVRRREAVATRVSTRSGRLVVHKVQTRVDPGQRGLSVALAAPAAQREWSFAEGVVSTEMFERFHVYNPSTREAEVEVELSLEEGVVEPLGLTVPPGERLSLLANDEPSIGRGVPHAATVRSLNGVDVVVERSLDLTGARPGRTVAPGATSPATRWLAAAGVVSDGLDEWIVAFNPGPRRVTLSVAAMTQGRRVPLQGLQSVTLAAGRRRAFKMNDLFDQAELSVMVESTAPVFVERAL